MSIISGFEKVKNYVKTSEGYKLLSRWTSSDTVDVNGKTLTDVVNELGTASKKDVASSGNASTSQVVMGNDTRLSDARKASDVYVWAKASTKPTYTASEVGAAPTSHTHDDRYYTESEVDTKLNGKLSTSLKGSTNGLAELDSTGKVPSAQLPSFVDDVIEGYLSGGKFYKESAHTTQITSESGKIYIDLSTEKTYRWSGSAFVVISDTITLGETSTTAYRGDRGKIAYDHSQVTHARTDATKVEKSSTNGNIKINGTETTVYTHPGSGTNPHGTTKSDVGLGNVDNTADANKSVKYATSSGSAINASKVNNHTVESDVPSNAKFTDTNTWIALKGATTSAAGTAGYAPAPSAGAANRYLRSDGTWSVPPDTNTTYTLAGLMGSSAKGSVTQPVYWNGSAWANTSYTLGKSVPSNAVFTDTIYDVFVKSGSSAKSGLVPAPPTTAGTTKFLREDGAWSNPPTAAVMTGATASANGSSGLVPQPVKGDQSWFLRGDGKWAVPSNTWRGISSTYTSKITDAATTSLSQEGAYNLYTELNGNLKQTEIMSLTGDINNTVKYYKSGYMVVVYISPISYSFTAWTNYILGVLPNGYRPKLEFHSGDVRVGGYVKAKGRLIIHTNGQIIFTLAENNITNLEAVTLSFSV